ncbi:hypothetical protein IW262DRAFT_768797 [Armillaria fumosa]|nr:hypothetical protein IW262DRAFT_768797 [Armillaria fumosa]
MVDVRSNAVEHLTLRVANSPIARILLGRKFSVAHWISSGYADLAKREGAVSLEEAGKIGLETALLIQHVRESLWKKDHRELNRMRRRGYYYSCSSDYQPIYNYDSDDYSTKVEEESNTVEQVVESAFKEELKYMEDEGDSFKE